jgi:hypothetical protein
LGDTGVITSHNFPFDYRHNLSCKYSIVLDHHGEVSKIVCLTFFRFALEGSSEYCSFDYLKLEDANVKYCGHGVWQYGRQPSNSKSTVWSRDFCCECCCVISLSFADRKLLMLMFRGHVGCMCILYLWHRYS